MYIGNDISYIIKKRGLQRGCAPLPMKKGAQAPEVPPKGTMGVPSGVALATFLYVAKMAQHKRSTEKLFTGYLLQRAF